MACSRRSSAQVQSQFTQVEVDNRVCWGIHPSGMLCEYCCCPGNSAKYSNMQISDIGSDYNTYEHLGLRGLKATWHFHRNVSRLGAH